MLYHNFAVLGDEKRFKAYPIVEDLIVEIKQFEAGIMARTPMKMRQYFLEQIRSFIFAELV